MYKMLFVSSRASLWPKCYEVLPLHLKDGKTNHHKIWKNKSSQDNYTKLNEEDRKQ